MSSKNKPLILVDGSSYLYRAFHALPPLTNSRGQPTGAAFGVANMLKKLLKDYNTDSIAVIFDAKGKTFRDDLFAEYKAHRPPMPDDLQGQIEPLHKLIRALGIPLLIIEGVEADDVIGTLAHQATQQGIETIISTGDKDMAQLVNPHITLINTMTNVLMDEKGVEEKFGIPPNLIIDYLTLVGDSVDNIPGIPGVGPKTAVKWLKEYGSLEAIIQYASDIKGKVGENFRENLHKIPLSKQLTTIKTDVALQESISDLKKTEIHTEELIEILKFLEFRSWLEEVLSTTVSQGTLAVTVEKNYSIITDINDLKKWLDRLSSASFFSFDTETTSLDNLTADLVGVSFAVAPHEAAYVPVGHDYPGAPTQLDRNEVLSLLKPLLTDPNKSIIMQNAKFELGLLKKYQIDIQAKIYDTMLESYVLDSIANRHDMDTLALKYIGHKPISFEDIAGKGSKQITFNQVSVDVAGEYAAEDADVTFHLHQKLYPRLEQTPTLHKVFDRIEMPLVPVLSRMECHGVLIDGNLLKTQSDVLAKRIEKLQEKAFELAGTPFNLGSPKQLQEILFTRLKLPILQKTPTGQPSTGEEVLEELALDYPLPKVILEYRGLSKLKSTYTDRLPEQINPKTGRVHTSYHQAITATGRLSSSDPNLQNIPIRSEDGRAIRKAFIAPAGYKILAADYSQIELRIMAHVSKDPGLLKAFANDWDIHQATAAEIFGITLEEVDSDQRRHAKAINFGLMYGMSAFGLSKQINVGRDVAQKYMDVYFTRYPGVLQYMENTRQQARKNGYVQDIFGRRLYLPEINVKNVQRQRASERAAINAPLQGTSADIIKLAMIAIDHWIQTTNAPVRMIMQVHDELVFEVADEFVEEAKKQIEKFMCNVVELAVPLKIGMGLGYNWDEAH